MKLLRTRPLILLGLLVAGLLAAWNLGLDPRALWPEPDRWELFGRFLGAAFRPAVISQADGATGLGPRVLSGAANTVAFAAAAMSLSLVFGLLLGLVASERWWRGFGASRLRRRIAPAGYGAARVLIALLRSVHELLWAILFLGAFGLTNASAVLAISIPYGGTLAKVFSEMLDEAPPESAHALRAAGATPLQSFVFGLFPRALPDMGAYAFYRFECALRSSAILGFFGFPTLGKYIYESFGELYFREAWTYLYALLALIVLVEWWSGALRRRLTVA